MDNPSQDLPETQFGPYQLIRRIGQGAMGEVLLAIDPQSGEKIALKRPWMKLEADRRAVKRFEREARAASSVQHPNICRVLNFGRVEQRHYITMQLIEGVDLAQWLPNRHPVNPRVALELVKKLAQGLHAIHATGVLHRDLKPANIMITHDDEPIVTDFGMANLIDRAIGVSRLTPAGTVVGTPAYMSPEQILAEHDQFCPATDLYGLGIILYELLCGSPPFTGSLATILGTIVSDRPPALELFNPDLDSDLNAICQKALEKDPGDRYQSGHDFVKAIDAWLSPASGPEDPTSSASSVEPEDPPGVLTRIRRSIFGK